jgi:hypothetical protein
MASANYPLDSNYISNELIKNFTVEALSKLVPGTIRMILPGEDVGTRRGNHQLIALSLCEFTLSNEIDALRCIEALQESDRRLQMRPDSLKLWDWQTTFVEVFEEKGLRNYKIKFGVAWYQWWFYLLNRNVWYDERHQREYLAFNATPDNLTVAHMTKQSNPFLPVIQFAVALYFMITRQRSKLPTVCPFKQLSS